MLEGREGGEGTSFVLGLGRVGRKVRAWDSQWNSDKSIAGKTLP